MQNFLNGKTLFGKLDNEINHVLMPLPENANQLRQVLASQDYQTKSNKIFHCDLCNKDIQSEKSWKAHIEGKRHKKVVAASSKLKKLAQEVSESKISNG